ncbi:MAG TPA: amidohydrolase [Flavobacterium sp.]|jgi:predicted amidohydrolase
MRLALIQAPLIWEKPTENLAYFEQKINSAHEPVDVFILPEMFTTGFTMNPSNLAETMDGSTVSWMRALAESTQAAICGSLVISESGNFYNRFIFAMPSGEIHFYDKRHLFSLAGEDKAYASGKEKIIIDYRGFRICPQICYDLRFPAFSRNSEDYDLLIYVANWPAPRIAAWDALLKARAIENLCFVAGVNRIGEDYNGHLYPGKSQLINYLGEQIIEPMFSDGMALGTINKEEMLETRKKLGFLNDRDIIKVE